MNKWVYVILAFLFGGIGIHKIYEGMFFKFLIYLCFSWTFIPVILGFIEGLQAALCWE